MEHVFDEPAKACWTKTIRIIAIQCTVIATVLVTGGAGFIGSHLVDELLRENHKVVVIDDLSGGYSENINPQATFVDGSILDYVLLKKLFEKYGFEYVFHLADDALVWLEKALQRGYRDCRTLHNDRQLSALWQEPRFNYLLQKCLP